MLGCGLRTTSETIAASSTTETEFDSIEPENSNTEETAQSVEPNSESDAGTDSEHASFYTIATYDKESDPNKDLALTLEQAKKEKKRVILQIGGDWCGWCARISDYMSTNQVVLEHLENNFLVMKVTYPGQNAEQFLAEYPKCNAYPHFFVLDENGKFLHSQGTGELEEGDGYNNEKFMAFLNKWTP